jgi:hypothetical protein
MCQYENQKWFATHLQSKQPTDPQSNNTFHEAQLELHPPALLAER